MILHLDNRMDDVRRRFVNRYYYYFGKIMCFNQFARVIIILIAIYLRLCGDGRERWSERPSSGHIFQYISPCPPIDKIASLVRLCRRPIGCCSRKIGCATRARVYHYLSNTDFCSLYDKLLINLDAREQRLHYINPYANYIYVYITLL